MSVLLFEFNKWLYFYHLDFILFSLIACTSVSLIKYWFLKRWHLSRKEFSLLIAVLISALIIGQRSATLVLLQDLALSFFI